MITDDRYSEIITDSLRVDVSIGAFNMAVAGHATVDQHVILKEWGRRVDPKVVLLQMGVNDFPRNALFLQSATVERRVPSRSECSLLMSVSGSAGADEKPCSVQSWLQRRSALYLTVAERWNELRLRNGVTNSALASVLKVDENAWESTEEVLVETAWLAESLGAVLVVFYSPLQVEVLVKDPAQGLFIERQLEGLVQRVSSTSGVDVRFVPVTAALREHNRSSLFLDDVHLTREGHELLAMALLSAMRETVAATR